MTGCLSLSLKGPRANLSAELQTSAHRDSKSRCKSLFMRSQRTRTAQELLWRLEQGGYPGRKRAPLGPSVVGMRRAKPLDAPWIAIAPARGSALYMAAPALPPWDPATGSPDRDETFNAFSIRRSTGVQPALLLTCAGTCSPVTDDGRNGEGPGGLRCLHRGRDFRRPTKRSGGSAARFVRFVCGAMTRSRRSLPPATEAGAGEPAKPSQR